MSKAPRYQRKGLSAGFKNDPQTYQNNSQSDIAKKLEAPPKGELEQPSFAIFEDKPEEPEIRARLALLDFPGVVERLRGESGGDARTVLSARWRSDESRSSHTASLQPLVEFADYEELACVKNERNIFVILQNHKVAFFKFAVRDSEQAQFLICCGCYFHLDSNELTMVNDSKEALQVHVEANGKTLMVSPLDEVKLSPKAYTTVLGNLAVDMHVY